MVSGPEQQTELAARADFGVHLRPTEQDPPQTRPWGWVLPRTLPLPLESEKACASNKLNTFLTIGKPSAETLKSEFLVWNLSSILYKR